MTKSEYDQLTPQQRSERHTERNRQSSTASHREHSVLDTMVIDTDLGPMSQREVESMGVEQNSDGSYSISAYHAQTDMSGKLEGKFNNEEDATDALSRHNAAVRSQVVTENRRPASKAELQRREEQKQRHQRENERRSQGGTGTSVYLDSDNV